MEPGEVLNPIKVIVTAEILAADMAGAEAVARFFKEFMDNFDEKYIKSKSMWEGR